jgi:hypothetical protein
MSRATEAALWAGWRLRTRGSAFHIDLPFQVEGEPVEAYDVRPMLSTGAGNGYQPSLVPKTGFVLHHDAVAFTGADLDFDGETFDESVARIEAIARYHVAAKPNGRGWPGIAYHLGIDPAGRLFILSTLDLLRYHVGDHNGEQIGFVMFGNFADATGYDGKRVAPLHDRPTDAAIATWQATMQWIADTLERPFTVRPHKFFMDTTGCPGTWTLNDAWAGEVIRPAERPAGEGDFEPDLQRELDELRGKYDELARSITRARMGIEDTASDLLAIARNLLEEESM